MRQIIALVVILGGMLAGLGILFSAPIRFSEEVLVMLGIAFAGSLAIILRGPLGKALVGGSADELSAEKEFRSRMTSQLEEVLEELREVRQDNLELQERIDFAERLLAQNAEQKHLEAP